jgi:hypothetical protein
VQVESENYDEFLKALGVGMLLRKVTQNNISYLSFNVPFTVFPEKHIPICLSFLDLLSYFYSLFSIPFLLLFIISISTLNAFPFVRHVTGNDKDYLRKIPRVVW